MQGRPLSLSFLIFLACCEAFHEREGEGKLSPWPACEIHLRCWFIRVAALQRSPVKRLANLAIPGLEAAGSDEHVPKTISSSVTSIVRTSVLPHPIPSWLPNQISDAQN